MSKDEDIREWLTKPSKQTKYTRARIVCIPKDHPYYRTSNKGNIAVSRLIVAEHLKRNLTKDDIVLFKNGDKSDERIDNLILLSIKEFSDIKTYKVLVSQLERLNSSISIYRKRITSYGISPNVLDRDAPIDRYWEIDRDREAAERAGRGRRSDSEE